MANILNSSISILGSTRYGKQYLLKKSTNFYSYCSSSSPPSQTSEDKESFNDIDGNQTSSPLVLVERYSNGAAKRYVLDGNSSKQTLLEQHNTVNDKLDNPDSAANLNWLPDSIKVFILPAGFPESVSDDYLEYMLWQFPTNVTGWICHALVTSSLLKACLTHLDISFLCIVNIYLMNLNMYQFLTNQFEEAVGVGSFSGSAAAASAAAIRWVSKDGIGAVGRLIIGLRL